MNNFKITIIYIGIASIMFLFGRVILDEEDGWYLRHKHLPIRLKMLQDAYQYARENGTGSDFIEEITICRLCFGSSGLQMGHLWWVLERVGGRIDDPVPPQFPAPGRANGFAWIRKLQGWLEKERSSSVHRLAALNLFFRPFDLSFRIHDPVKACGHPGPDVFHPIAEGIGTQAGLAGGMAQQGRNRGPHP